MNSYPTFFENKKVLITGGLGFIGSNIAHRLVQLGSEVTLVDSLSPEYGGNLFNIEGIRDKVTVSIGDIGDRENMPSLVRDQDVILNLAGQVSHIDSMRDPQTDLQINCQSHVSLLEVCRHHNPEVKIVYASTRQIYGRPSYLPVDERHSTRPIDVNGINKMAAESYHLLYNSTYDIRACAIRLTNTYGPRQIMKHNRQGFLPWFIRQAIHGEDICLFGNGQQVRDVTYVDDVVDAFLRVAASDATNGRVFNLGGTEPVSLRTIVETLITVTGCGSYHITPFPLERKAIDIGDFFADYAKIKTMLGWEPKIDLAEGLTKTVDYYHKYGQHYW